jgi:hypothetical protein
VRLDAQFMALKSAIGVGGKGRKFDVARAIVMNTIVSGHLEQAAAPMTTFLALRRAPLAALPDARTSAIRPDVT